MTRTLVIDCGAAQTRACLFVDGGARRFFFAPARGDEAAPRALEAGDVVVGRVRAVVPAMRGAFVDVGEDKDGLLSLRRGDPPVTEGAAVLVRVRRPAIAEKGALLSADWRAAVTDSEIEAIAAAALTARPPHVVRPPRDAVEAVLRRAEATNGEVGGPVDGVVVGGDIAALRAVEKAFAALEGVWMHARVSAAPEAFYDPVDGGERGAADALEAALEMSEALPGGGRLHIEETKGGCVVDIDTGTALGDKSRSDFVKDVDLATTATATVFAALDRRAIGGQAVLDFPPSRGADAAKRFAALLRRRARAAGWRLDHADAGGLAVVTRPRVEPSLLELASAPDAPGAATVRAGRRVRARWAAFEAVAALERALRRAPSARPTLSAGAQVMAVIEANPAWRDRLAARFGARFDAAVDDRLESVCYDVIG